MKRGRKSLYKPELHIKLGKSLAQQGYTDEQIAEKFGIVRRNLQRWKNKYPELRHAIQEGKDFFDSGLVEGALLKAALGGYTVTEKRISEITDAATGKTIRKKEIIEKEMPPNVTAISRFLANRCKDRWKESKEGGENVNVNLNLVQQIMECASVDGVLKFGSNGDGGEVKKFKQLTDGEEDINDNEEAKK